MNYIIFRIFTFSLLSLSITLETWSMKRALDVQEEAIVPLSGKKIQVILKNPLILSGKFLGDFLSEISEDILQKIVVTCPQHNALRKTCKRFAHTASTNNLLALIACEGFQGSTADIMNPCEQCIETNNLVLFKSIVDRYKERTWYTQPFLSYVNTVGYSLHEYAYRLNREKFVDIMAKAYPDQCAHDIESIKERCEDSAERNGYMIKKDMHQQRMTDELCDRVYLHRATGNYGIIEYLLKNVWLKDRYIEIAGTDHYATMPLHIAAYQGDITMIQLLLHNGYNVNMQAVDDYTPLHIACMRGSPLCVKALLDAGADPNKHLSGFYCPSPGKTPLYYAAQYGFTECARLILDSAKLIDKETACQVALLYATQSGCAELVELLLARNTKSESDVLSEGPFDDDQSIVTPIAHLDAIDLSIIYNDLDILKQLIVTTTASIDSLLKLARDHKHSEIIEFLENIKSSQAPATEQETHQ